MPILIAFILAPINTSNNNANFQFPQESAEVAKEQLRNFVHDFVKDAVIFGILTSIIQAISSYSVSREVLDIIRQKDYQITQTVFEALKNLPQAAFLNVLSWMVTILVVAPPFVYLYSEIMKAESFTIPGSVVNNFFFLAIVSLLILLYVAPASLLLIPAYVKTKSIRSALKVYRLALNKLFSTIGFGIFVFTAMVIIGLPTMLTRFIDNQLLAGIIKAPFNGLSNAFSMTAATLFYLSLTKEIEEE
ncbi:hypothetical protein [Thermococcus paralvinellae]|uniref:Glycerophosphoryl diester phosphodiesterase membrane domain-containing protein n=1 Tax=Thermococcus paralvinellae TaxID=582419 RepID=W0I605_9EURY|nr:hypothetical protein [Thermococcus paralvinellae]AHF80177.1 Hypothetical protein TES1_0791 [Thermococcus paralvinellae]